MTGRGEWCMTGRGPQHHQHGLVLVPLVQELQCPPVNQVCEIILFIIIPMFLCHSVNRHGVVVELGVPHQPIPGVPPHGYLLCPPSHRQAIHVHIFPSIECLIPSTLQHRGEPLLLLLLPGWPPTQTHYAVVEGPRVVHVLASQKCCSRGTADRSVYKSIGECCSLLSEEVPGLDERSHGVQEHVLVIRQHHDYVGEGGGAPGQGEDAQQGEEGDHDGDGTYTQEYRYTLVSIL